MKKSIALAAFLGTALFSGHAFGQESQTVKLNVELHPMLSIQMGGAKVFPGTGTGTGEGGTGEGGTGTGGVTLGDVTIQYTTAEHYLKGNSVRVNNQFTVYSTEDYIVEAKALDLMNNSDLLEAKDIELIAYKSGSNESVGTTERSLSAGGTELLTGLAGTIQTYDVEYKGAGNNAFLNKIKEKTVTTYSTDVVYTITAQ